MSLENRMVVWSAYFKGEATFGTVNGSAVFQVDEVDVGSVISEASCQPAATMCPSSAKLGKSVENKAMCLC